MRMVNCRWMGYNAAISTQTGGTGTPLMEHNEQPLLSIADFLLVLIRRKWIFLLVFCLIFGASIAYALLAKKTFELTGTVYVGKFQGELLEDGEFVVQKLEDYSFIKKAMEAANVSLDIPITRLQKLIKTEVVNEVKKTKDVGLVQLNVRYKDKDKVVEVFQALTNLLIQQHLVLLNDSIRVLEDQQEQYKRIQTELEKSIHEDEALSKFNTKNPASRSVPSLLLLEHTISEKRAFRSMLNKDLHEVRVEAEAATTSFNTRLASQPEVPDSHLKPKLTLTVILGFMIAGIFATAAAFLAHLYITEIKVRL